MPLFMTQATYSPAAWANLIQHPQDRREAIGTLVTNAGGTLHHLYYALDTNAIVFLFDAPNAMAAAAVMAAGTAAGHIAAIHTTPLITAEESLDLMRQAATLGPARPATST